MLLCCQCDCAVKWGSCEMQEMTCNFSTAPLLGLSCGVVLVLCWSRHGIQHKKVASSPVQRHKQSTGFDTNYLYVHIQHI